ncbi:MAG: hypothetical protein WEB29_01445 [Chloroflexota bacterium]
MTLRLIGSLAVSLRCETTRHLTELLGRRVPRDIDFVGYSTQAEPIEKLFASRGYLLHPAVRNSREWGVKRLIYTDAIGHKVDVFLDELVMAHTITFAGRLERDERTVSLADLLLSKLQIHRITENDLIDMVVLLGAAGFGPGEDQIDLAYIAGIMAADWGFFHTTLANLAKLGEAVERYSALSGEVAATVRARARELAEAIEAAPKTTRWRLRARIGTRVPWYEDVEEVDR